MAGEGKDGPPPGFMDGPEDYDLEELIHVTRLVGELDRLVEQILSVDPNGMMRIYQVLHRAGHSQGAALPKVPDRGLH